MIVEDSVSEQSIQIVKVSVTRDELEVERVRLSSYAEVPEARCSSQSLIESYHDEQAVVDREDASLAEGSVDLDSASGCCSVGADGCGCFIAEAIIFPEGLGSAARTSHWFR